VPASRIVDVDCTVIGTARTPFGSTDEAPRQGAEGDTEGVIELDPAYAAGLDGFDPSADVLVVWYADRADRDVLRLDRNPDRGVFTSRSPARPTPVCLTRCSVVAVEPERLRVRGVDMVDGTPVLDLKPPLDPTG